MFVNDRCLSTTKIHYDFCNKQGVFDYEKIMITGALGQIGTELVVKCRALYGNDNVLATDIREPETGSAIANGPFEILDVTDKTE